MLPESAEDHPGERFYAEEVNAFLQRFADRNEPQDVVTVFKDRYHTLTVNGSAPLSEQDFGHMHPIAIGRDLTKKYEIGKKDRAYISEILRKTYPLDATTGFYAKQCMPDIVGLAHFCARETDIPVCIVEGDFTNVRMSNDTIGIEKTNKLIHVISGLVKNSLAAEAQEVHAVLSGGDETRLVVYGLKADEVNKILEEKVHPAINLLSARFGLHDLKHSKEGKSPGFGAGYACMELNGKEDDVTIRNTLDAVIKTQKEADAKLRSGLLDDAETKNRWEALIGPGGAYHALAKEYPTKNPRDFFNAYSKAHERDRGNAFNGISMETLPKTQEEIQARAARLIPFWDQQIDESQVAPEHLEDPEMHRLRTAMKVFGFDKVASAVGDILPRNKDGSYKYELPENLRDPNEDRTRLQQMIVDLMRAFDAPDPTTRCKSSRLIMQDGKRYKDKNKGMQVLRFEVTGMGDVNGVNTELTDAMLRQTTGIIKKALEEHPFGTDAKHMPQNVHYDGNGIFKAFVPFNYPRAKRLVIELQVKAGMHLIGNKQIMDYAEETYACPSEGREEQSREKLAALQQKMAELKLGPTATMSEIVKSKGKKLGITFSYSIISEKESVEDGMSRIDRAAQNAGNRLPG